MVADPDTGHIYVAESANFRISEFTAWGVFVKAWGWNVAPEGAPGDTPSDQLEICTTSCQIGIQGHGPGQLNLPYGLALDSSGDLYVFDRAYPDPGARVQKFSVAGQFLLMWGGEVNQGPNNPGDLCTAQHIAEGDTCGAGSQGTVDGWFSPDRGNYITYNSATDSIFVGDKDRIQEFETDGKFKNKIDFEGDLAAFDGMSVSGLASDNTGNLYLVFSNQSAAPHIYKLSATGEPLAPGKPGESSFKVSRRDFELAVVAVDGEGSVYTNEAPSSIRPRLAVFDPAGNRILPTKAEEEADKFFPYIPPEPPNGPEVISLATNLCLGSEAPGNLFVFFVSGGVDPRRFNIYGTPPIGCESPPPNPPDIGAQYVTSVDTDGATLKAQINPRFWNDTTYYVEYGIGKCFEGGCESKQPAPPGAKLTNKVTNSAVTSAGVILTGLEPGTTYRYRFVAQSSGGGPVAGVGGKPGEDGGEGSFTTFLTHAEVEDTCPNRLLRTSLSAKLPDCRAYEMVSPLDKNGGDAAPWMGRAGVVPHMLERNQSAVSGERFTFSSPTSFAGAQSTLFTSHYLAERTSAGWSSESIAPVSTTVADHGGLQQTHFTAFSPDLCLAWFRHYSAAPLAAGAVPGFANLYRRDNCAAASAYEALTNVAPSDRSADSYRLNFLGSSEASTHAIFTASGKLHEDAPELAKGAGEDLLYELMPAGLRFVCYLPSGNPVAQPCMAGAPGGAGGDESNVHNAVSADGQRIFWTAFNGGLTHIGTPGRIFARIGGQETLAVSGRVAPDKAWYWTAADDGSKVIFAFADGPFARELYELDVDMALAEEVGATRRIAKGVLKPMGASEDASRIYFASTEDLAPGASEGANNLYLYEAGEEGGEGSFTFIMALSDTDEQGEPSQLAAIENLPAQRLARVSADGMHVAFSSFVSPTPTGYDNTDAASGEPDQEVYLYDAEEDELRCVSCNPTGARPTGENIGTSTIPRGAAARLQGWEAHLQAPRVLSEEGDRVYFESLEVLVPRDTNAAWDVYQWEEPGTGSCTTESSTYGEASGGCVDLISTGQSPKDSFFLDADPSGRNVFFSTQSSLLPQDTGLSDVYVARVGGGLPQPSTVPGCEGEACQGPVAASDDPTPASSAFEGAGNVTEPPRPTKCAKGRRAVRKAGRTRCIKKPTRNKKKAKRANTKRRAGR